MESGPDRAKQALVAGQYDGAVILFAKELYQSPDDGALHMGKACAYIGLGDLQSALAAMRRAAAAAAAAVDSHHDDNDAVEGVLAQLYGSVAELLEDHDDDAALANDYHREAVRLRESDPRLQMNRIRCLCRSGQTQAAVQAIGDLLAASTAAAADPIYADLLAQRHRLYLRLERYDEAIGDERCLRACLQDGDDPRLVQAREESRSAADQLHTNAQAHVLMGAMSKAITLINTAVQLNDTDSRHYRLRATIHRAQGDHRAALADLHAARDRADRDPIRLEQIRVELALAENQLAIGRYAAGQFDAALDHLHRCVMLAPGQAQYHVNRADCYVQLQRRHHAQADYQEALRLLAGGTTARDDDGQDRHRIQVKLSAVHYQFGVEAFNRRDLSEAASEFTEAIRLSKRRIAPYFTSRAETFEQMQKPSLAIPDYIEALQIDPNHYMARDRVSALRGAALPGNDQIAIRIVERKSTQSQSHRQQILARRNARMMRFRTSCDM